MAWALVQDGRAQMIDLRGRNEAGVPRVPGARPIALDELPGELETLHRERPVLLLSGRGQTAARAMQVLRAAGMTACAVEGGMRAWLDAGLPIEDPGDPVAPRSGSASSAT